MSAPDDATASPPAVRAALLGAALGVVGQAPWWGRVFPWTPDSAGYVGIAWRLLNEGRLVDPVGFVGHDVPTAALHWPPGYPVLLAAGGALGLPLPAVGLGISAVSAVGLVALTAAVARRYVAGAALVLAAAWVALHPGLASAGGRVLTDAPFALLCLGAVSLAARDDDRVGRFALAGFLAAAALSIRWSAVALLPPLALGCLIAGSDPGRVARRVGAGVLGALPILVPLLLWRLGSGDGPRVPVTDLGAAGFVLAKGAVRSLAVGTLAGGVLPVALGLLARGAPVAGPRRAPREAAVHLAFAASVIGLLVAVGLLYQYDGIDDRTVLAAVPSMVIATCALGIGLPRRAGVGLRRGALAVGLLAALGVDLLLVGRSVRAAPPVPELMERVHEVAEALPAEPDTPVVTTWPAPAVLRPDLTWRRAEVAPNGGLLPVDAVLDAHPEHAGAPVVYLPDWEASGGRLLAPACDDGLCMGRLPAALPGPAPSPR